MADRRKTVVYQASGGNHPFGLLPLLVREMVDSRWLTYQLFRRNFTALYRQSVFGVLWAIAVPLVSAFTFIYLNVSGVLDVGSLSIPYPLYAIAGIALWQLFSMGLTLGSSSLVSAGAMLTKVNFTRESLIFSSVAQSAVPFFIQIGVVLVLFAFYRIVPPITILLLPLAVIPLALLTLGLAFILALVNGVLRDIGYGLSFMLTFLMLATPVVYVKPLAGLATTVNLYNPLYYLVSVPRDLMITGATSELAGYVYSSIFSLLVFLLCWTAFHVAEGRVVERI